MKREKHYDGKGVNKPALILSLCKNPFLDSIPLLARLPEDALSASVDGWTARLPQPHLPLHVSDSPGNLIPLLTSFFRNTLFSWFLPREFSSYLSSYSLSSSWLLYIRSFEDSVFNLLHSRFSSLQHSCSLFWCYLAALPTFSELLAGLVYCTGSSKSKYLLSRHQHRLS